MRYPAVKHTEEFRRIAALPRRRLRKEDMAARAAELTPILAERGSNAKLRPGQGIALHEVRECRGGVLGLPVGLGKTIVCYTLATLLGAKRPLMIVPASLEDKTWADIGSYRGQWRMPRRPFVIKTREELVAPSNAGFLDRYKPDLIVIDETDDMANASAGAPRILDRYRVSKTKEECVFVVLTGTLGRKSILDYWHLVWWALPDSAPLPRTRAEASVWAAAIDHRPRNPVRPSPGPLGEDIDSARRWYLRRLLETPGVVILDGDTCKAPLHIDTRIARENRRMNEVFEQFNVEQQTPGGEQVSDPLSRWKLDGFLGCGLYKFFDPPPPTKWVIRRRKFARFVRRRIADSTRSARPLDTERQVVIAYRDHVIVRKWLAVKKTFKAKTRTHWFSKSTIRSAVDWLRESDEPGIIWCGSVDFAERLARESGLSYYGRKGRCATTGVGLHAAPEGKSLIASWNANKKGFNLQAWTRMLVVMPPQSAKWIEQLIGRAHRSGQLKRVLVTILITSGGTIDSFKAALAEAEFVRDTTGLTQKVLRARIKLARPKITPDNEYRWASRSKEAA
jgi:hypothetical protein